MDSQIDVCLGFCFINRKSSFIGFANNENPGDTELSQSFCGIIRVFSSSQIHQTAPYLKDLVLLIQNIQTTINSMIFRKKRFV